MKNQRKYRHLFFDLDHTLWDFDANSKQTIFELFDYNNLTEREGIEADDFHETYLVINESKWDLYRQGLINKAELRATRFTESFAKHGFNDLAFSQKFEADYLARCPHQTALLPGAIAALEFLKDDYELHIITNGFIESQETKLTKSGLAPYFKQVVSSDEVGVNKPHPKIFEHSLGGVKAQKEESLMIGDNLEADIIGAQQFGIDQVYYNPYQQAHEHRPTFEISDLLELKSFL